MKPKRYRYTLLIIVVGIIFYALADTLPRAFKTYTFDILGRSENIGVVVTRVGSSMADAISPGDIIVSIDNKVIDEWRELYGSDLATYSQLRQSWVGRPIQIQFLRGSETHTTQMKIYPLSARAIAIHFGVRLILFIVVAILIFFLMFANPKDQRAQLVTFCFSGVLLWVASDTPMWPAFMAPIIPAISITQFGLDELIFTFSLQFTLSSLLHILLVFPERRLSFRTMKVVIPAVYILPIGVMLTIVFTSQASSLLSRAGELYAPRLWLDTGMLVIAAVLICYNYVTQRSPFHREQIKWVMLALLAVVCVHLVLWNIPIMLNGEPMVSHYEWMYLSVVLLPIAITLAIANHRFFGMRGLVRGRLLLLRALLQREHDMVLRRDERIGELNEEIETLQNELTKFTESERQAPDENPDSASRFRALEAEYPPIAEIRRTQLLGSSPLWIDVFRNAVLASKSPAPVMILGESGTGKTVIANLIHQLSNRRQSGYREVSCAQFEHSDPAFALGRIFGIGVDHGMQNVPRSGRKGLLQECDGGTLLLDDFDRLPLNVQDLLLYPLEHKPFEPGIGNGPALACDIKFILASNRSPEEMIDAGLFHHDVMARLGVTVLLPPLRYRTEDIPILVDHFLQQLSDEFDHTITSVSPRTIGLLKQVDYRRGNVRELMSELRHAIGQASLEGDDTLRAGYLSPRVSQYVGSTNPDFGIARSTDCSGSTIMPSHTTINELEALRKTKFNMQEAESLLGLSHKSRTLSHHLRGICLLALCNHDWNIRNAACWIVGTPDQNLIAKIERKINRYLRTIQRRRGTPEMRSLFSNLPAPYHDALKQTISFTAE